MTFTNSTRDMFTEKMSMNPRPLMNRSTPRPVSEHIEELSSFCNFCAKITISKVKTS